MYQFSATLLAVILSGHYASTAQPVYKLKPAAKQAQSVLFEKRILAGYNIGASTPLSIPNTIRKINAWWPTFNPSIGYEVILYPQHQWSWGAALTLEYKGMGTKDEVQYFHTIIDVTDGAEEGKFEGDFSGSNKTVIHDLYATIPLYARYRVSNKTDTRLGIYVALLLSGRFDGKVYDGYIRKGDALGEKVTLNEASFDFGSAQRTVDYGIHAGISHMLTKRLNFKADLNWGLACLFPSDFTGVSVNMYHIYLNLGIGYLL